MVFPDRLGGCAVPVPGTSIVAQEIDSFILNNPALEPKMSKKTLALAALTLVSGAVFAQAAPETTLTFNAGVVTDYRYRGITQSRNEAAVQGGVDYAHKRRLGLHHQVDCGQLIRRQHARITHRDGHHGQCGVGRVWRLQI
jgi:hypothetical protein